MERFNVPIPPDDDFPQVICAQRRGDDFQTEYVEYVPRWKVDGFMVVDKSAFFALADTAGGLERMLGNAEAENAKLRELVRNLYTCSRQTGCDRCSYREACDIEGLMRELGVEVDE